MKQLLCHSCYSSGFVIITNNSFRSTGTLEFRDAFHDLNLQGPLEI